MGVTDVPQWLSSAFVRSVQAVGATAPREEIAQTCRRLLDRWQEPDRRFHNVRHLTDLLARVDELAQETHHPDAVRLAAWYHGAIFNSSVAKAYARSGGEDEVASAELATAELTALGVPAGTVARIAEMITNLRRHDANLRDIDCLALCDADLATLAVEPQRYRAYRSAVRAEYAHIPDRHYLEARTTIVGKLLARRNIFLSPMGGRWEDRARENLRAELDRLEAELAALGASDPGGSVIAAEAAQGRPMAPETPREAADHGTGPFPAVLALDGDGAPLAPRTESGGDVPPARRAPETDGAPARVVPRPVPAPAERDAAEQVRRTSSLESGPDDLRAPAPDREHTARSAREAIDVAVQLGRQRALQDRLQRERLEAARAEREQVTTALRERRRADGSGVSAATPAEAPPEHRPAPPEHRPAPPEPDEPAPTPQHGIEREPELFDVKRRRKGR